MALGRMSAYIAFALLAGGTTLGLAGIDLVLPAIPGLPNAIGGSAEAAQFVLGTYAIGTAMGLLLFGELGARFDHRNLLVISMVMFALLSALAAFAPTMEALIGLRFFQGATGAAPAVFAPGMLRALFQDRQAIQAIGLLGSIESIVPAIAPIVGLWLLSLFGWQSSFLFLSMLSIVLVAVLWGLRGILPTTGNGSKGTGIGYSYLRLLRYPTYLRYALSQAFSLGALLTFVFGAPVVIVSSLGGTLTDFVVMQVSGITFFVIGANVAARLAERFGAERMILFGSSLSCAGAIALSVFAVVGSTNTALLAVLFVPMNFGFGLRGPVGFFRAVVASNGDEARGSALVILSVLMTTALGTAIAAPFITDGMVPLTLIVAVISSLSVVLLIVLKPIAQD